MLVLTRNVGQKIIIGEDICVRVIRTGANSVKLGIDAPKEVPVHREEVWNEIRRNGRKQ